MALALPLAVEEMGSAQTWGSTPMTLGLIRAGVNLIRLTKAKDNQGGGGMRKASSRLNRSQTR